MNSPEWSDNELGTFKKRVMRKIYWNWFSRRVLFPGLVVLPVATFIIVKELERFSLSTIFSNILLKISHFNIVGLFNLALITLRQTELDVVLITISSAFLAAFFARKIIREFYSFLSSHGYSAALTRPRRS